VIFYDQRGGGKSELPADTSRLVAARQIQDLDEIRRHFGLTKVTLLAHSYGPLLAASYAIAHPDAVKKMVLLRSLRESGADLGQYRLGIRPPEDRALVLLRCVIG
jgi:pimeloyl-ACP methyl ester carboxylesterase